MAPRTVMVASPAALPEAGTRRIRESTLNQGILAKSPRMHHVIINIM